MTNDIIIKHFKKRKPKNDKAAFELLKSLGVKTKYIDEGAFREVHRIVGHKMVMKFPLTEGDRFHTVKEIKMLEKMRHTDKYKPLRQFIPEVYYTDAKSGIIIMKEYEPLTTEVMREAATLIGDFTRGVLGDDCDVYSANLGVEKIKSKYCKDYEERHYKFIDLGLFK